ncbi:hypothetical protein FB562_1914 [Homoserinimonas aerilata]|uniref:Uncharacterized protein n=1 Tax=Homoserinimonas aerilata TaxID=1162970 RepID=A0A542YL67_9MICO|nr:hypothetical protein FB562_1914 [Homoserinimonas aerilata]
MTDAPRSPTGAHPPEQGNATASRKLDEESTA